MILRRVLIEGWRGISHSYALVNQHQILALLDRGGMELYHRDLPYFGTRWNTKDTGAGFDPAQQARIDALPRPPDGAPIDVIYRIGFPPRDYGGDADKVYCFSTLEYFNRPIFYTGAETAQPFRTPAAQIVTPSRWSKAALVASGISKDRIVIVPHGIDPAMFRPLSAAGRAKIRSRMGVDDDTFVFLNVSAMTRNKGIVTLLNAFHAVNQRHPKTRLVLKDQAALYQSKATRAVNEFRRERPDAKLQGLMIVSQNLSVAMLRELYSACDAYVSPYLAEGFNLPPLEAAACGTPIVVTAGGATDDYADPSFALKIASRPATDPEYGGCLEPDLDSLIDCMEQLVTRRAASIDMRRGVAFIQARHSWAQVAARLSALF
jgi:glycosyltransferase involved in cell wall biosynthesis